MLRASEVAQYIKVSAANPDNLSFIPRIKLDLLSNQTMHHGTRSKEPKPGEVKYQKENQCTVTKPLKVKYKNIFRWEGNAPVLLKAELTAHHIWKFSLHYNKTKRFQRLTLFPLGNRIKRFFSFNFFMVL